MEDSVGIPFGVDEPAIAEAYLRLPENCRRCPEVLELLAGFACSSIRSDLGRKATEHVVFIAGVASRGLDFIAKVASDEGCAGSQDPDPTKTPISTRRDCPVRWLIDCAGGAVHYGIGPEALYADFLESNKSGVGFEVPAADRDRE